MVDLKMKSVLIDCSVSGVAGNMFLGALLDLDSDETPISKAIEWVKENVPWCRNVIFKHQIVKRGDFQCHWVDFVLEEKKISVSGEDFRQYLLSLLKHLEASPEAQNRALKAVDMLLEAESRAHGVALDKVHLHEAGSVDTLLDIACSIFKMDMLDLLQTPIYHTPVAVGKGWIDSAHGRLPVPAPATLEIMKTAKIPFIRGPIEGELATPTGVALVAALATSGIFKGDFTPHQIGKGAGTHEYESHPNLLRLVLGHTDTPLTDKDLVEVLETNVDDVSGETIGYTLQRLTEDGAYDASAIPLFSKKNRPAYLIQVLCSPDLVEQVTSRLMRELGTLGVRQRTSIRHTLVRETKTITVSINNKREKVHVKLSRLPNGTLINIKPEFEDVQQLARKYKLPFREIFDLALNGARANLGATKPKA